jgi:hypothetical protein
MCVLEHAGRGCQRRLRFEQLELCPHFQWRRCHVVTGKQNLTRLVRLLSFNRGKPFNFRVGISVLATPSERYASILHDKHRDTAYLRLGDVFFGATRARRPRC